MFTLFSLTEKATSKGKESIYTLALWTFEKPLTQYDEKACCTD